MRVRRREVNIFNMSLLDILCGALGAFCFMMLALFPSYIEARRNQGSSDDAEERIRQAEARAADAESRAREADVRANQERANQTLVAFSLHWNTTDDVDLVIAGPNNQWWGPKKDRLPSTVPPKIIPDRVDGTKGMEGFWVWDSVSRSSVYRIYAELATRSGPAGPVPVRIYGACRFFTAKGEPSMAMPEFGGVSLITVGQRVELGVLEFGADGAMSKFQWNRAGAVAPGGGGL